VIPSHNEKYGPSSLETNPIGDIPTQCSSMGRCPETEYIDHQEKDLRPNFTYGFCPIMEIWFPFSLRVSSELRPLNARRSSMLLNLLYSSVKELREHSRGDEIELRRFEDTVKYFRDEKLSSVLADQSSRLGVEKYV
jgi:hypothetical protein